MLWLAWWHKDFFGADYEFSGFDHQEPKFEHENTERSQKIPEHIRQRLNNTDCQRNQGNSQNFQVLKPLVHDGEFQWWYSSQINRILRSRMETFFSTRQSNDETNFYIV